MELLSYLIIVGAVVWAISKFLATPPRPTSPPCPSVLDRDKEETTKPASAVVTPTPTLELSFETSQQDLPTEEYLVRSQGPFEFTIPDRNAETLSLSYDPYEWPADLRFKSDLSFWITHPHRRDSQKRWYDKEVQTFQEKQKVLGDYEGEWINADAKVVLVPVEPGRGVKVVLNGLVLHKLLPGSESLIRRMKRQKLDIKVTKCHARLEGGGTLSDGTPRGIYVALDLKPFRRF